MFKPSFLLKQLCLCFSIFLLSIPQGYSAVISYYGASGLNPLVLVDEASGITTFNIYGSSDRVATVAISSSGSDATPSYFHKDHLSSTTLVTDTSASMLAAFDYQPYGESTAYGDNASSVTYRYSSEQYEPETGLYNYHARLYSPTTGTFGALDPAGDSISPYTAFRQNPVNFRDLNGQLPIPPGLVRVFHFIPDNTLARAIKSSGVVKPFGEVKQDPNYSHLMEENVSSLSYEQRYESTFWTAKDINKDIYSEKDRFSYIERFVDPTQTNVYNMLSFRDPAAHERSKMGLDSYLRTEPDVTGQYGRIDIHSPYEPTHASTRDPSTGDVLWYEKDTLKVVEQNYNGEWVALKGNQARSVKDILDTENAWIERESGLWQAMVKAEKSPYVNEVIRPGRVEVHPDQVFINEKRGVPVDHMPMIPEDDIID